MFRQLFGHTYHIEADQPWSGGHIWWLCLQSQSSPSWPGTVAARADHPYPGSHLQSSCWGCVAAAPSGSTADQKLYNPRGRWWETETRRGSWRDKQSCKDFTHPLPSSGHTSYGPRISSRLSGWSWRSRQTCAPSSLPAERAVSTKETYSERPAYLRAQTQTHLSRLSGWNEGTDILSMPAYIWIHKDKYVLLISLITFFICCQGHNDSFTANCCTGSVVIWQQQQQFDWTNPMSLFQLLSYYEILSLCSTAVSTETQRWNVVLSTSQKPGIHLNQIFY